ncbi:Hybrid signal transduction histidine kinase [Rhizoctonia solani]|uniref:Hybrid signal transduction histidine kinase n=1 Tax=Rhizoctonia solani TaxID=456999 RepID=A0A8H8NTY3_9AGAM|nr:Hybrid signal transduction histidine kinase [Rhizoctonia solani]QRW18570.1 Hybrid signal transduction histidine kinase [Rhizoctonia solani]
MCVCAAAFMFYLGSSVVASIVEDFPYTTIVLKIVRSAPVGLIMKKLSKLLALILKWASLISLCVIGLSPLPFIAVVLLPLALIDTVCGRPFWDDDSYWRRAFDSIWDNYTSTFVVSTMSYFINKIDDLEPSWLSDLIARLISHFADTVFGHFTSDQVTSHCLHWLIKYCETPSSTTVALQAISGAASNIPPGPLKDCEASFKILQRLVSGGSGPTAVYDASLYARALSALTTLSQSKFKEPSTSTEDLAVMIWNLKLQHEHNLTVMIGDGEFVATKKNLEALQTGNSASSYAIRLLQGSDPGAKKAMKAIMTLLSINAHSSYQQLHPAAVRSLANGAALLEACSDAPLLSISDVQHFIIAYQTYIRKSRYSTLHDVTNLGVALTPLVDALRHRYLIKNTGISNASVSDSASVYLLQALRRSADKDEQDVSGLVQLYWIWCTEVATNPAQCGLDPSSSELTRLKAWCSRYLSHRIPQRYGQSDLSDPTPGGASSL